MKMDFAAALEDLKGYHHFYSAALRGKVCSLLLKLEEAMVYFQEAEQLAKTSENNRQNLRYKILLRVFSLENTMLLDAMRSEENTLDLVDKEMERFLEIDMPEDDRETAQLQMNAIGCYQLLKRDYPSALLTFRTLLIESQNQLEDQQVGFYWGIAAASHELGDIEIAERNYENAALALNTLQQPLKLALFCTRLFALLSYWKRPKDANQWLTRLKAMECPEESMKCLLKRAHIFSKASADMRRVFIA